MNATTDRDERRAALFAYDPIAPLAVARHARTVAAGLVEERFSYRGLDQRVPAVLTAPAGGCSAAPVLLIQHGLNSGKDDERLAALRRAWAGAGFACLTIDAPRHGERAVGPLDLAALLADPAAGLRFVQETVLDLRRLLDCLGERDDLDTSRIGYCGFSMSTLLGVQFVAVEQRVGAACFAMGGAGLFHALAARVAAAERAAHEQVADLIDPLHFASWIAPRPVLQVNGLADEVIPALLGHMLQGALREPKEMVWYAGGHGELPDDTVATMRRFFAGALGHASAV